MRKLLIPSLLVLLASVPGARLQAQEDEQLISFNGLHPSIALQESGGFVLVWDDYDHIGDDSVSLGIFGRVYDAQGKPGARFRVNKSPAGYQTSPRAAADARGNFVVVYSEPFHRGGAVAFGQRYDAEGAPRGPRFQVNEAIKVEPVFPALAMEPGGAFVVAWYGFDHERSRSVVGVSRFTADGARFGRDLRMDIREDRQLYDEPLVAIDAGGFAIGWTELAFCQEEPLAERIPVIARFEPSGQPFAKLFRLSDGACDGTGWILGDLAGAPVGSLALFQGLRNSVQRFTLDGEAAGRRLVVGSSDLCRPGSCDELPVAMAVDHSGRFAVVWNVQSGERHDLVAQRFDEHGRPLGGRFPVSQRPSTDGQTATAALDDDGTLVVAWRRYGFPHNEGGLVLRRFPG